MYIFTNQGCTKLIIHKGTNNNKNNNNNNNVIVFHSIAVFTVFLIK